MCGSLFSVTYTLPKISIFYPICHYVATNLLQRNAIVILQKYQMYVYMYHMQYTPLSTKKKSCLIL